MPIARSMASQRRKDQKRQVNAIGNSLPFLGSSKQRGGKHSATAAEIEGEEEDKSLFPAK